MHTNFPSPHVEGPAATKIIVSLYGTPTVYRIGGSGSESITRLAHRYARRRAPFPDDP
jgi:hypothetical protein